MLYLGPIETRLRLQQLSSSRPKATTAVSAYAKESKGSTIFVEQDDEEEFLMDLPPHGIERRKNSDRRATSDDPFLETRANKDRRKKRRLSINVSV